MITYECAPIHSVAGDKRPIARSGIVVCHLSVSLMFINPMTISGQLSLFAVKTRTERWTNYVPQSLDIRHLLSSIACILSRLCFCLSNWKKTVKCNTLISHVGLHPLVLDLTLSPNLTLNPDTFAPKCTQVCSYFPNVLFTDCWQTDSL